MSIRRRFGALGLGMGLGGGGGVVIDPDAQAFIDRVLADGGTVEDAAFLNSFVLDAKANNYWSDIVAAYSPSWGVKGGATASDLYSVIGAGSDIAQPIAASQMTLAASDLNGKPRLVSDGIDDFFDPSVFTNNQPSTLVIGGFNNISHVNNKRFTDGGVALQTFVLRQTFTSGQIGMFAGSAGPVVDIGLGNDSHVRGLFNGASSAMQEDGNAEVTGDVGLGVPAGLTVGASQNGANPANWKYGMLIALNAAVDANYAAKMAAIYNFSKSAYGTA